MENVQKQWFENKITVIGTEIEKLRKAVNELSAGNEDKLKLLSEIEELQVVFETIKGQKNLEKLREFEEGLPAVKIRIDKSRQKEYFLKGLGKKIALSSIEKLGDEALHRKILLVENLLDKTSRAASELSAKSEKKKKILQEIEEIKVGFGTLKKRYERKGLSREDYERAENYENELLLIETEIEEAKRMERLFEKMGREIVSKPAKY